MCIVFNIRNAFFIIFSLIHAVYSIDEINELNFVINALTKTLCVQCAGAFRVALVSQTANKKKNAR